MRYTAPTTDDLQRLKNDLGLTGEQMAALFGVAGGQQWRKYTGGAQPREMAPQMLFFGAARLALTPDELERVLTRMRAIGAEIDIAPETTVATEPGHAAQD
ncbi:XRE family transcriptional regulator [Cupriavidus campinensis]